MFLVFMLGVLAHLLSTMKHDLFYLYCYDVYENNICMEMMDRFGDFMGCVGFERVS